MIVRRCKNLPVDWFELAEIFSWGGMLTEQELPLVLVVLPEKGDGMEHLGRVLGMSLLMEFYPAGYF